MSECVCVREKGRQRDLLVRFSHRSIPQKNESTLSAVRSLLAEQKYEELRSKFFPRISFGTAGVQDKRSKEE